MNSHSEGARDHPHVKGHEHGHDHGHAHSHDHRKGGHHHVHTPSSFGSAFAIGIALNTCFVAGEAVWGVWGNSLSLLADAGHNLGDVLGLAVAWMATRLARRAPTKRYTYGLGSSSILAALSNAVVLLVVTGGIAWAAIIKLVHPSATGGATMVWVALIGVAVNGITALLFASGRKGDLNIRGAFLHMASDAALALGVAAAGAVILLTGWRWLDPAVSLAIGAVIVLGTWSMMREALDLALQAVPTGVDRDGVLDYLRALPGVREVHDLHIWGMSTTENALTAHLVRPDRTLDDTLIQQACADLRIRFRVHHATLQIEAGLENYPCELAPHDVV